MKFAFLYFSTFYLLAATLQAQTSRADLFNREFDKALKVKNAAFNNGKIHFNQFRSIDKTTRYFPNADFVKGEIIFDGQRYADLMLKYDLLKDEPVIKFDGEGNQMGFNPVKARVNSFTINGIKFTNLDLVEHPTFISGFYEETDAQNVKLYTKYRKEQFASLTNEAVFYTYVERHDFVFKINESFIAVNSGRDLTKEFPQIGTQIEEFFRTNAPLEKSDRRQFMKKLAVHLNDLLNSAAK